jgi:hypothetical protein
MYQISKIPASAPEYAEASKLSAAIKLQVARENEEAMQKGDVEVTKNPDDPRELSWETAQKNFQGAAHDGFVCAMSTENQPIVSFDDRLFWWKDDGRCADSPGEYRYGLILAPSRRAYLSDLSRRQGKSFNRYLRCNRARKP